MVKLNERIFPDQYQSSIDGRTYTIKWHDGKEKFYVQIPCARKVLWSDDPEELMGMIDVELKKCYKGESCKRLKEDIYEITYDYDDEWSGGGTSSETFEGTWSELQDYIQQMRRNGCYNIDANEVYEESMKLKEADYSETDEFTLIKEMNHWIKALKTFFVDDSKVQKAVADYFYYDDGAHQEDFKELQASVKTLHKLWLKLDAIVDEVEEKEDKEKNKKESIARRSHTANRNKRNGQ